MSDPDCSPFGAGWEHAPPGSMGPAKFDPPPPREDKREVERDQGWELTRNSSSSSDSTSTSPSSGGGSGPAAGGGGGCLFILVVVGCIWWANSGDPKKDQGVEEAKNVPALSTGKYKVDGVVPVVAGGRVTLAKLVGVVTFRAGRQVGQYSGTYSGDWGVGRAQGTVEAVQQGHTLVLTVAIPGTNGFLANLTHQTESGRWLGKWNNGTTSGEFNLTQEGLTPSPGDTPPKTDATPTTATTGLVVVRGKDKLATNVTAYLEVDGKRTAEWPTGGREVRLTMLAGHHKVVLRSRARVMEKGRSAFYHYKHEFEIEVVGGQEQVKEIEKVDPDPNGKQYW